MYKSVGKFMHNHETKLVLKQAPASALIEVRPHARKVWEYP